MAFDENTFNTTIATAVTDSFNDVENNELGIDVGVTDSFNEDNSVNDSGNATVGIEDSFQNDSHNTDIDVSDSGNTDSFNDFIDASDHSVNDDSINAGVRSYNTGFGDLNLGGVGAGGAGGTLLVNNHNTVVDQSVNGNIASADSVFQVSASSAQVATGEGAISIGGDYTSTTTIDASTNIGNSGSGDVLIDSEKTVDVDINSGNTNDFDFSYTDESVVVDVTDSFNDYSVDVDVTDSFNDESVVFDYTDVDLDVDAIVGSQGAAIADDINFAL